MLQQQIEGLTRLARSTEKAGLLPKDKLVVAVSERLANNLARLALPQQQLVAGRYRVLLEKADVRFRDEQGSVRFDGRIGAATSAGQEFFAELTLFGVVDTVEVDRRTGVLRCNVAIVDFALKRFDGYGDSEMGRLLLAQLGRQGVDVLKTLAFPIEIPVRLEQEILLKGVAGEGPVKLQPASLPLRLSVADVAAHAGRLWVAVDVTATRGAAR